MTEIRKLQIGSDDGDLTHKEIKSLPKAKKIPKDFKEHSKEDDDRIAKENWGGDKGYYHEAYKHGYKVHAHPEKEVTYLSKDPTYKNQHKNK